MSCIICGYESDVQYHANKKGMTVCFCAKHLQNSGSYDSVTAMFRGLLDWVPSPLSITL